MKALRPSSRVRSRRRISSVCCESTGRPGREGQSIFETAATQTPRNSPTTGGGPSAAGAITAGGGAQPANHAAVSALSARGLSKHIDVVQPFFDELRPLGGDGIRRCTHPKCVTTISIEMHFDLCAHVIQSQTICQ